MKSRLLCLAILSVCTLPTGAAASPDSAPRPARFTGVAGDSVLDAETRAISSELRCPVCQGVSIQESPSELAQEMRTLVREQLLAGQSPDQIKSYFVSKYGEWILLEPKPRGMNMIVYALPALVVAAGLGLIAVVVRRWTRPA